MENHKHCSANAEYLAMLIFWFFQKKMSTCPSYPPTWDSTNLTRPFEGGHHYLHCFHHSLASGQTKGTQPCSSTENLIKDLLSMAPPNKTQFPPQSVYTIRKLPQAFRGQTQWKPPSQKTNQTDHSLVSLNETKPCCVGPPKMGGSRWRGLTQCGPHCFRREWQTTSVFLP